MNKPTKPLTNIKKKRKTSSSATNVNLNKSNTTSDILIKKKFGERKPKNDSSSQMTKSKYKLPLSDNTIPNQNPISA